MFLVTRLLPTGPVGRDDGVSFGPEGCCVFGEVDVAAQETGVVSFEGYVFVLHEHVGEGGAIDS